MEMYQAGRNHILKATLGVDANLYVKTELKETHLFCSNHWGSTVSLKMLYKPVTPPPQIWSITYRAYLTLYILNIVYSIGSEQEVHIQLLAAHSQTPG